MKRDLANVVKTVVVTGDYDSLQKKQDKVFQEHIKEGYYLVDVEMSCSNYGYLLLMFGKNKVSEEK